jgi:hypothetical protein
MTMSIRNLKAVLAVCALAAFIAAPAADAQAPGCIQQVNQLKQQAMEAYVNFDTSAQVYIDQAISMEADPNCQLPTMLHAKLYLSKGIIVFYLNGDSSGALEAFKAALTLDYNVTPDPNYMSSQMDDIWSYWTLAKKSVTAPSPTPTPTPYPTPTPTPYPTPTPTPYPTPTPTPTPGYPPGGYGYGMAGMVTHTAVTEQIRRTPVPLSIQVNPSLMPSVESVTLYFQLPGETIWNSKQMTSTPGGVFTAKIDCSDGMYIFDPDYVSYYIIVTGQGGTVLVNEPPGQATSPHVVKMVQMLAGQPPTFPGTGPEMKCREITCFSTKECEKELGVGSECFEGICTAPLPGTTPGGKKPKEKGAGLPGYFTFNLGLTPATSFGLVNGKPWDRNIQNEPEGQELQTGFAWGGPALKFNAGYFLPMGLGFTVYYRMQFLTGENKGWDDDFDMFAIGGRINFMAVKKPKILLNVYLGGGYGSYRHKIKDVPHPCYDRFDYPGGVPEQKPPVYVTDFEPSVQPWCPYVVNSMGVAEPKYKQLEDFWKPAGYGNIGLGTTLFIRPVDVFGISAGLDVDFLFPSFAMNIDFHVGVAFFFGNGFKEKGDKPANTFEEPGYSDPMMY